MLFIYPPVARSAEPPLGIAKLAAFLKGSGREARCVDLCQEGIEYLLAVAPEGESLGRARRGALKRRGRAAEALRDIASYAVQGRYSRAVSDLGLALGAASTMSGVEVSLADYFDPRLSPLSKADLERAAAEFEANVFFPLFEARLSPLIAEERPGAWVGVSICFLSQALCAFALIGFIKAIKPELHVAIGGGLVTSWLAGGIIDGGETFGGLVDASIAGPGEDWLAREFGMEARRDGPALDLDDFPGDRYFAPRRIIPYSFSSGCPWKRCSFCPEKAEDMPYRGIPAPRALRELDELGRAYSPGLFHFTDNEVSPLYLSALAASPPGAPWYGFARFSSRLLDPEFCGALAASGCVMLQLGLESGDQRVLDRMQKGTRIEDISRILENLEAASIGTYIYVLFGTPAEDRDSALRSRDFLAARADEIDFLNLAIFNLPAASGEARELSTKAFYEGDLSLYSEFEHPAGWNRGDVRRFLSKDFRALPELRDILARTPPVFTSSHAPFFLPSAFP